MGERLPSREVYDRMVEREKKQAEKLAGIQVLVERYDGEFWKLVSKRFLDKADGLRHEQDVTFWQIDEKRRMVLRAQEDMLRWCATMPDDFLASYEALKQEHSELKEEIREYKRRLKAAGI